MNGPATVVLDVPRERCLDHWDTYDRNCERCVELWLCQHQDEDCTRCVYGPTSPAEPEDAPHDLDHLHPTATAA